MEDKNLLSFSLQSRIKKIVNRRLKINKPLMQVSLFFCNGKYSFKAGVILLLMFNSIFLLAQTTGGLPVVGITNCIISPTVPVCPNSVITYSAPTGMSSYAWTITGSGTITGSTNNRTVNVTAGSNCNTSYTLTITYMNALVATTCSRAIAILDNTIPTIVAPQIGRAHV